MKLSDLSAETGVPERLVRFLIAEGIVPPPEGGRRFARYDERHLRAVRRYLDSRRRDSTLAAIRSLATGEAKEFVSIPIQEGVELRLHPRLFASGEDSRPILTRIARILGERLTQTVSPESEHESDRVEP